MKTPDDDKSKLDDKEEKEQKLVTAGAFYLFSFVLVAAIVLVLIVGQISNSNRVADIQKNTEDIKRDSTLLVAQGNDIIAHQAELNVHANAINSHTIQIDALNKEVSSLKNVGYSNSNKLKNLTARVDSLEKAKVSAPPAAVVDDWDEEDED